MKLILWKCSFVIFVITFASNVVLVESSKVELNTSMSGSKNYNNQKRAKLYEKDEFTVNQIKREKNSNYDSELLVNQNNSGYVNKSKSHKSKPKLILSTQENDNTLLNNNEGIDPQYSCFYPTRYLMLECTPTNYILQPVFEDEDDSKYIKYSINLNNNKFIRILDEEKGKISISQSDVQPLSFIQITCTFIENEEVNETLIFDEFDINTNKTTFNLFVEVLYNLIPTDILPIEYPKYFISDKIVNDPMIYGVFFPFSIPNIPITVIKTLKNSSYYYMPNVLQTQIDQSNLNYGVADYSSKILIKTINEPNTEISIITFKISTFTLEKEYSYIIYNSNFSSSNNNNNLTYINQYNISIIFNFISLLNISDSDFISYFENEIYNKYFKVFLLSYNDSNKNNDSVIYSNYDNNDNNNNLNINYPHYTLQFEISIIPIIKNETIEEENSNNNNNNSTRLLEKKEEKVEIEERVTKQPIFQLYSIIQSIHSNISLKNRKNKNMIYLDSFFSNYEVTEIPIININYNDNEEDQTEVEEIKSPPNNSKKKVNTAAIVIPIVLLIIIIIIVVAVVIWYFYYYKRNHSDGSKEMNLFGTFSGVFDRHKSSKVSGDYDPYIKDKVLHEGYLWKEGRNRIAYKFQKRYVVIYKEPPIMRVYESMCPSFYGNVYIHEKQSIPMECFRCVEKESQIQFMCRFAVQNSQKKQMSVPEQNGICDERIFRFRNNDSNLETAIKQTEEWIQILREFEKQNARPKPIQVWYDNQTLKRDVEDNNKLLPVSTPTSKHSSSGNTRVSSAIASASRRKRALEIKRQLRTPQRLGLTSTTLVSTRGSVGTEIELNQLQDYDSDTFRTPKYSSTTQRRGGGGGGKGGRERNSELTLHDLPKNNNNNNINHHFISPTRLFQNRRKKKKESKTNSNYNSGTSSGEEEEEEEGNNNNNNNNNYRKKGLSEGDKSILHPFLKNKNINLPPIAPLKTPIPTLQIHTERDGYSSTKLSSQLVSRKQTRDSEEDGKIDLDDDGISEK